MSSLITEVYQLQGQASVLAVCAWGGGGENSASGEQKGKYIGVQWYNRENGRQPVAKLHKVAGPKRQELCFAGVVAVCYLLGHYLGTRACRPLPAGTSTGTHVIPGRPLLRGCGNGTAQPSWGSVTGEWKTQRAKQERAWCRIGERFGGRFSVSALHPRSPPNGLKTWCVSRRPRSRVAP